MMNELIKERYSPKNFLTQPVESEKIETLFQAARLAASSMNEQPWRFIYAVRGDENFSTFYDLLKPGNQEWAENVPMFVLTVAKKNFEYENYPNRFAFHDVGLATQNLMLQAISLGLATHPMGGYDREEAVKVLGIPKDFEPVAMLAVGYLDENKEKRPADRKRKPLHEIAFRGIWSPL